MGTTGSTNDVAALRARVIELEAQNLALEATATQASGSDHASASPTPVRRRGRWRAVLSVVLIAFGLILAPLAVLGPWVRAELIDTDKFVATLAPLVEHAEVQGFIADQAMAAFDENVPVEALVGQVFDGLSTLDLPEEASAALTLLEGPAAAGVRSLVESGVTTVVASPQFAQMWQTTLRETHSRAIEVLQGQPGTLVVLSEGGVLSLDIGELTGQIKNELQSRGIGFADAIPTIDRTVTLVSSDALAATRTLYLMAVGIGYWMPVIVLCLLAAGIIAARRRARALAWTAAGTVASLLVLASGIGIGRSVFVSSLSPAVMTSGAAGAIYAQVITLMVPAITALILVSLIVMIAAWLAGDSAGARSVRGMGAAASNRVHRYFETHGIDTHRLGSTVERWRSGIVVLICTAAVLIVLLVRPLSVGLVGWTVGLMGLLLLAVELVRKPAITVPETAPLAQPRPPGR